MQTTFWGVFRRKMVLKRFVRIVKNLCSGRQHMIYLGMRNGVDGIGLCRFVLAFSHGKEQGGSGLGAFNTSPRYA